MTMCIEVCPEMVRGKGEHHLLLLQMSCPKNEGFTDMPKSTKKHPSFCIFTHATFIVQLLAFFYKFLYNKLINREEQGA